jgi:hypothetical protein
MRFAMTIHETKAAKFGFAYQIPGISADVKILEQHKYNRPNIRLRIHCLYCGLWRAMNIDLASVMQAGRWKTTAMPMR